MHARRIAVKFAEQWLDFLEDFSATFVVALLSKYMVFIFIPYARCWSAKSFFSSTSRSSQTNSLSLASTTSFIVNSAMPALRTHPAKCHDHFIAVNIDQLDIAAISSQSRPDLFVYRLLNQLNFLDIRKLAAFWQVCSGMLLIFSP